MGKDIYTREVIRVEYEWQPPRCAECKNFGRTLDKCPKGSNKPVNTTSTSDVIYDGFNEVVGRKHKGKKTRTKQPNSKIGGICLSKPKPSFYRPVDKPGMTNDNAKASSPLSDKHGKPSTSRDLRDVNRASSLNSFDVLNKLVEEDSGGLSSLNPHEKEQLVGNGNSESITHGPNSPNKKSPITTKDDVDLIGKPGSSFGEKRFEFGESDEDEVFLPDDEMSRYISSTGGGQQLEDEDLCFFDGYKDQVYDLPG
nr:hypothetical protein [Tanacetum cinerariifolium]